MASTWASPFWTIIAVTRSGCMTANRKPTDAPMSERYSAYEERFSFSVNFSVTVANRSRSEERRVGKECRSRWSPYDEKKKRIIIKQERSKVRYQLNRVMITR